jgi:hypothetical protein
MSITGLEQNPETRSNWARMAREGVKVMQFIHDRRYIVVVAAGKVTLYAKRTEGTNKSDSQTRIPFFKVRSAT